MIPSDAERQAPLQVDKAEPTHLARYQFAAKFVEKSARILDVPCGSGYGSNLLANKASYVAGVDIHQGAIQHAKELFQKDNTEYFVHDAEKISEIFSEAAPFDTVVSFEGIEHLPHPELFLEEIHKCLKPGGKLIISTPRKPHGSPYHIIEFSLDEFTNILSKKFQVHKMYGQIYTDIFDLNERKEDPHAYKKFNFIAECTPK